MPENSLTAEAREAAHSFGADLFGVADLTQARELPTDPANLFDGFTRGMVVGVRLLDGVIEQCLDGPTTLYEQHYLNVNDKLDRIAERLARHLESRGGRALPIPASQMLDKEQFTAHLSHKAMGRLAGLGWQGKSLLLVNPEIGPRFRMATVLTDLELTPSEVLRNRCGSCTHCTDACPAGAIKNVNTDTHYADRDEALYFDRCAKLLMEEFARRPNMSKPICGVCIRVCPWGTPKT